MQRRKKRITSFFYFTKEDITKPNVQRKITVKEKKLKGDEKRKLEEKRKLNAHVKGRARKVKKEKVN